MVFNFEEFNEQLRDNFSRHTNISNTLLNNFSQSLWENPEKALNELLALYNQSLDEAYTDKEGNNNRCFVEAMCGGPHEAIPSSFYNSIGVVYPFLNRELKNKSLEKILNILDGIRSDYIQISHTPYIREPLLISDIVIARNLYWPGMDEGQSLIKKYNNLFCDFKFEAIDEKGNFNPKIVNSDFIVGYSILRNDFCNWGEEYLKVANQKFVDRVINGITSMRFATYYKLKNLSDEEIEKINYEAREDNFYSDRKEKLNNVLDKKIFDGKLRLKELLPESVYNLVQEKTNQHDWAEPLFSEPHKNYILKSWIEHYTQE